MKPARLRQILSKITDRKRSSFLYGFIVMLVAVVTALACGWSSYDDHSVRFNYERTGRGFYRLPPLPVMYNRKTKKDLSVREIENYDYGEGAVYEADYSASPPPTEEEQIWEQARTAVQEKRLADARDLLDKYLVITSEPSVDEGAERLGQRNSAYDILDAVSALDSGSTGESVGQYINARYAFHFRDPNINDFIAKAAKDKNLNDNWEYLRAASLFSANQNSAALDVFQGHAVKYPKSEKNDAVLYMIAKLTMESSKSFTNINCGSPKEDKTAEVEPVENCRDENWQSAFKGFRLLMETYPKGRYFNDARGWLAFLFERGGDRARALAAYYTMLGHPTDRAVRLKAKFDIGYLGHGQDDATLDKVEEVIAGDSNAALAYAYHRIYNHATDSTYAVINSWCCYGDDRWQQKNEEEKSVSDARKAGNYELERIAKFAAAMMKRYPLARISGGFVLRIAEAQLELQNYPEALKLSEKALNMSVQGEMRMEGLWIKGSSEHRLNHLKSARATFKQLIAEFPKTKLTEGAQRLLAMTAEDQDDLETALETYIDLDYEHDVAYFVDVLLPTDRLAKFIDDRKSIPQYNQLLYGLGVRYMRDKRWNEARTTLRRVRTEKGTDGYLQHDRNATWYFAKEPDYEDRKNLYIKTSWVMQDLKTIDILEHYEQAVENAQGDENKAEAMYQVASRLFESDDLTFYNPAAWSGSRGGSLSELPFSDHERLPNETRTIFEHLQAHDPWARAIPIYLEIADRFPKTKTAKDALYSAAVAHQRLSERNGPWGAFYQRGLFAGSRMVTYADVKGTYPDYQLPRGTYGWEPSTRTVNGGPGWAPKPPPPKLTRTQNFERKFKRYFGVVESWFRPKINAITVGYASYMRGWLDAVVAAVGILLTGYLVLLGFHFRTSLRTATMRMICPEASLELLRDSESRIEKVIGDGT